MKRANALSWLAAIALATGLAACERPEEKGPAEKVGEKIDEAGEKMGEAMEDAGDEMKDAAD
jgi:hypothetical protein